MNTHKTTKNNVVPMPSHVWHRKLSSCKQKKKKKRLQLALLTEAVARYANISITEDKKTNCS